MNGVKGRRPSAGSVVGASEPMGLCDCGGVAFAPGSRALFIAAGKNGDPNRATFPALPAALFALLFGNPSWARSAPRHRSTASPTTTRDAERHRIADLNSLEHGPGRGAAPDRPTTDQYPPAAHPVAPRRLRHLARSVSSTLRMRGEYTKGNCPVKTGLGGADHAVGPFSYRGWGNWRRSRASSGW